MVSPFFVAKTEEKVLFPELCRKMRSFDKNKVLIKY